MKVVKVIGGGLAGCEAAYQLAKRGVKVKLYDMKPVEFSEAHKDKNLCELVCSNSLKSNDILNASGLLKEEMRVLDSLVIKCADETKVPSGDALSVNREEFSALVTKRLQENSNIEIIHERVDKINTNEPTIIATGPLTHSALFNNLKELLGEDYFYFFDAIAPIVTYDSIDKTKSFVQNRYEELGNGDYINCPLTKPEYEVFYNELVNAKIVDLHDFENSKVFEGCMPVEVMAKRGYKSLLFGPLKPVGLNNPLEDNRKPYAVVQLRKEDNLDKAYNLVGFQTNLTFSEQKRVFALIPALQNAEYVRFGTMHRNSFVNAPKILNQFYQVKKYPNLFIAGQLSGVEGYIESISSGLIAGINMARLINGEELVSPNEKTVIGGLIKYIVGANPNGFQPMGSNWAVVAPLKEEIKDKKEKKKLLSSLAIKEINIYNEIVNKIS